MRMSKIFLTSLTVLVFFCINEFADLLLRLFEFPILMSCYLLPICMCGQWWKWSYSIKTKKIVPHIKRVAFNGDPSKRIGATKRTNKRSMNVMFIKKLNWPLFGFCCCSRNTTLLFHLDNFCSENKTGLNLTVDKRKRTRFILPNNYIHFAAIRRINCIELLLRHLYVYVCDCALCVILNEKLKKKTIDFISLL